MNSKKLSIRAVFAIILLSSVSYAQEKENMTYSNITEFGFRAVSPRGIAFDATTVNGIAINKQHLLGIGIGIGGSFIYNNTIYISSFEDYDYKNVPGAAYMLVYLNYRCYFNPQQKFSPHINISLGGLMTQDGYGGFSSITAGFRAGRFSFASGFSFMPMLRSVEVGYYNGRYDDYGNWYYPTNTISKWYYPFGFTLKVGFSFE